MSMARRAAGLVAGAALALAVSAPPATAAPDQARAYQWYLQPLGITKALTLTRGGGVKVAVIDSGVASVPDLHGAVVGGKDFSGRGPASGAGPIAGDPEAEHGTGVASVLAGRGTGPDTGVLGSAPGASLLTASFQTLAPTTTQQLASAIRWSVDNGASVLNLSNGSNQSPALQAAIAYAESKDVVVVAATGNEGTNRPAAPANYPGVVGVTGIDKQQRHDADANYGEPGTAIAAPYIAPVALRNGLYTMQVGTSLAAPIVAGVVALIRAKFPSLNAANVVNRLLKSATPAGGGVPNEMYGYGIVNAYNALTKDVPQVAKNPLGSLASDGGGSSSSGPTSQPTGSSQPSGSSGPISQPSGSGTSSSGLGAGGWIGIIAAIVVVLALVIWFVARGRRSATATGGQGGPGPGGYRGGPPQHGPQGPYQGPPQQGPPPTPPAPPPPRR